MPTQHAVLKQSTGPLAVAIAVGQSVAAQSNNAPLPTLGLRGVGVHVPAATYAMWTAASLALQVSNNGTDWVFARKADGSLVSVAITGAGAYAFPAEAWPVGAFQYMRVVSVNAATEALVPQTSGSSRLLDILPLS